MKKIVKQSKQERLKEVKSGLLEENNKHNENVYVEHVYHILDIARVCSTYKNLHMYR